VAVLVRDIETKQPVPTADVLIFYPFTNSSLAPCASSGKTAADGIVRLRAAPYGEYGIRVEASAPGYMSEGLDVGVAELQKIESAHWFEATEQRPANFVLELYAEPRFGVELVLPPGYRGLVQAHVQIQDEAPCPAGQRCFRFEVPPSGVVSVTGPGVLRRVFPAGYRARYADGSVLTEHMDARTVGFRWLKAEGPDQVFVVGTQNEYDSFSRELMPHRGEGESSPRESSKGSGRGGRRRQATAPSSP
jgi:hypothetical protein